MKRALASWAEDVLVAIVRGNELFRNNLCTVLAEELECSSLKPSIIFKEFSMCSDFLVDLIQ